MDVHVSLVGRRGLAAEIYRQLRAAILDGRLRGGERLPPTRELAGRLGVSRTTVTEAYDRLVSEGYATGRVGAGTFVTRKLRARRRSGARPPGALRPRPFWSGVRTPALPWHDADFDFRPGIPDAGLFPYRTWRGLMARHLRPASVGRGSYGDPAGHAGLRAAIAHHVGVSRGAHATTDDVVVTNGTQQALDLVARVLLEPGDRVAVEDPGYPPAHRMFASHGARVTGVRVDDEGMVVDEIPSGTRLVYVTPSHQFPLGVAMSLRRRIALVEWARRHDAAVIEDDYDSEFRFDGRPLEPLQSLDTAGRVVYVGSFSKTLLATLRLGFLVAPASLRPAIEAAKWVSDWHTALPTQAALAGLIESGEFARHVRRSRSVYQDRHERLVEALGRWFAGELDIVPSSVGLHVSVLARHVSPEDMRSVVRRASAAGIECQSVGGFAIDAPPLSGLLLGYGAIGADRIDDGLRALRDLLHR